MKSSTAYALNSLKIKKMKNCKLKTYNIIDIENTCIFENYIYMVWVDTYIFENRFFIHNPVQEIYHELTQEPLSLNLN